MQLLTPIINFGMHLPFYSSSIAAGFPSPADDHIDQSLDLTELLVSNPPATFYLRVSGLSMVNAGVHEKDILVVDRSLTARHGDIVVAQVNEEFTVKRFYCRAGEIQLHPENDQFEVINISNDDQFSIFGVVSGIVRQLRCSR